ncbi:MAG: hypothetical protein IKI46_08255 [Lachnospiraceae bacterium]|nr:hypothetical protein [Lachnospiraceae bacterium]
MNSFNNKIRRFVIPNLTLWLIAGYVVGYIISMVNSSFLYWLSLDPYKILHGQVWRLITWVIIPPNMLGSDPLGLFFVLLMLFCCYSIGNILERVWGTVKYNIFIFTGIALAIICAFIYLLIIRFSADYEAFVALENANLAMDWFAFSTYYINVSIYIVFAMTYPNNIVRLYFILPVKMKWLGIIDTVYLLYIFIRGYIPEKAAVIAALLNCLIFYLSNIRGKSLNPYQIYRRTSFNRAYNKGMSNAGRTRNTGGVTSQASDVKMNPRSQTRHKCAICGKTEVSDPDMEFRYCSKCAGSYEYCQTHLFTHTHVRG